MYYYLLYLLGYYTYEEEKPEVKEMIIESKTPIFPENTTIIKNRDLIIDKEQLRSGYKNVIDELKEKIKNNPNMIKN